ncbi:MAG: FecR family protein [Candidatus Neomarinimicrobiota bacterium]
MKRFVSIVIIILISVLLFAQGPKPVEFGKISLPLGTVEVSTAGAEWSKALPNRTVFVNDQVRTGAKSRCEITLVGGGKLRIGENSELVLTGANVAPMSKDFEATLKTGNAWISAKAAFGEKKNVSVRTPTAVAAIRGTTYRTQAGEDESSVLVYEGKVDVNQPADPEVTPEQPAPGAKPRFKLEAPKTVQAPTQVAGPYEVSLEDWITLVEGMQINVRKDGKYNMFKFDQTSDAELEFVKWNKELDNQ